MLLNGTAGTIGRTGSPCVLLPSGDAARDSRFPLARKDIGDFPGIGLAGGKQEGIILGICAPGLPERIPMGQALHEHGDDGLSPAVRIIFFKNAMCADGGCKAGTQHAGCQCG